MTEVPRVPVDFEWATDLEKFLREQLVDSPPPDAIDSQVAGVLRGGYCRDLGLVRYALGAPLEEVRREFRQSVEFTTAVYRLREAARTDPANASASIDASLTNSARSLEALQTALACGARDLATTLAPMIWDPANASYLGPNSVVCTPEDQRVAYALRDYLLARPPSSADLEHRDFPPERANRAASLDALQALVQGDRRALLSALEALHAIHVDGLAFPGQMRQIESLIDLQTLAFAAIGLERFPEIEKMEDSYLPFELSGVIAR